MANKNISTNNSIILCTCGKSLFEFLSDSEVRILGVFGEYDVNYNFLRIVCKNCKKVNKFESKIPQNLKRAQQIVGSELATEPFTYSEEFLESIIPRPKKESFFGLTHEQEVKVFKILTDRQITILKYILQYGQNEELIQQKTKLDASEIIVHINKIILTIEKNTGKSYSAIDK